jgi:hypothetical protein
MASNIVRAVVVALVATTTAAGCSSGTNGAPTAGSSSTPGVAASATPSPTPLAPKLDAKGVMDALKAAGLPLSNEAVQDENTDPLAS